MNEKRKRAHRFGLMAEHIAGLYLRCKGYRILASRHRNYQGEIDILALKGKTLVAVEVKARKSLSECEEAVDHHKQQRIARALEGVISGHRKIAGLAMAGVDNIRFDVVWIAPLSWPRHMKDAWRL